ncbi:peptidase [Methanosarcina sp. WH1]|uniref:SDH family Clp fold serine proteinase n=1 Tax=Methanosarcina sp. WH1 TaxID=1434102 RepID=UPI000615846D|nr:peptidase [Methanosarcina sp. WH1]AKB22318.1 periplasmic serine protease [Methanosarcina sp. WH1]
MGIMSEYIKKGMSAHDLEAELLKLIKQYNKKMNTYLIVYASAICKPSIPDISLNMDDYYTIFDLLRSVDSNNLDFYIETPGGSGEAAEEIVRCLRSKFDYVNFVVSGEAKSAGTIVVLSGNEILMTQSGSLGPIDAQMRIGRSTISAYDYMEWIKNKHALANKEGRLNPFDATMIAQISPGELGGVEHSLNFAKDLVVNWLAEYKFKDWNQKETTGVEVTEELKLERAQEIASELINHGKWRSHGRSLKIKDLEEIGLKIKKIDGDPILADIVYRIQIIIKMLFNSTGTYKIFATGDEKLFRNATPMNNPPQIPQAVIGNAEVADAQINCPRCGTVHQLYAKFVHNSKVDSDFIRKGFKPFPKNNKLLCQCGFEMDLNGVKNQLETQIQ